MATPVAEGPSYRRRGGYRRVDHVVTEDLTIAFRVIADIAFTPVVAIAVGVAGLLALLAAATRDRTSKIVVGALLVCAGIAAFIAEPDSDRVILEDAHGWLMVVVGGVLV